MASGFYPKCDGIRAEGLAAQPVTRNSVSEKPGPQPRTCAQGQSWADRGHSQLPVPRQKVAVAPGTTTCTPLLGWPGTSC